MTSFMESERAFLQQAARQRVTTYDGHTWEYFDCGKRRPGDMTGAVESARPLVCLPGTSGSARCFHLQMRDLVQKGYRVIAVQYPDVWTHEEWIHSFDRFLDAISLQQIHVYGVSLGAYLAQRYSALYPHRVASLVMTQGFCDTRLFGSNIPWLKMLPYMPEYYLKKYMLDQFPKRPTHNTPRAHALAYMKTQIDTLTQVEAATRLTLNCLPCKPGSWRVPLPDSKITLIDSYDETSLPPQLRDEMQQRYPQAKRAMIRDAGDFPFLSHYEEVNMHLQVHLRAHST